MASNIQYVFTQSTLVKDSRIPVCLAPLLIRMNPTIQHSFEPSQLKNEDVTGSPLYLQMAEDCGPSLYPTNFHWRLEDVD